MTKVLKPFYLLALYLAASFLNAYIPLENIRVIDGDTVKGKVEGKQITIRLVEIDAPEMVGAKHDAQKMVERLIEKWSPSNDPNLT